VLACSKEVVMRRRPFLLGLALLSSTLVAGAAVPALGGSKPPKVPGDIAVPAGQKVVLDVVGKGGQIYDCKPSATDPSVLTWAFREPAAVLYGRGQHPVGIHFRGPTFESFDGSSVTGTLQASVPAPEPGAIPWLLLRAVANQGDGVLGQVDFVQRIETRGGVAPAGPCDPAKDSTIAVPYRARYVFYAG
jgi:Protein of unknown function (DUF3455)